MLGRTPGNLQGLRKDKVEVGAQLEKGQYYNILYNIHPLLNEMYDLIRATVLQ